MSDHDCHPEQKETKASEDTDYHDPEGLAMLARDIAEEEADERARLERSAAMRRLRFARLERNPWMVFRDIVGEANRWPTFIREAYWSGQHFNDHQRMLVVNFAVLNGVHLDVLLETLQFTLGRHFNSNNRRYQVIARYNALTQGRQAWDNRQRVWSYHVVSGQMRNLNHLPVDSRGKPRQQPYKNSDTY